MYLYIHIYIYIFALFCIYRGRKLLVELCFLCLRFGFSFWPSCFSWDCWLLLAWAYRTVTWKFPNLLPSGKPSSFQRLPKVNSHLSWWEKLSLLGVLFSQKCHSPRRVLGNVSSRRRLNNVFPDWVNSRLGRNVAFTATRFDDRTRTQQNRT